MKRWTVYCHTHINSGRRYIGLTSKTMMHRWNQHCAQAKNSKGGRWYFPNAIRKYGKDAFSHEVLEVCNDLESANAAEEKWIEHFDTRNPEKGFNITKGGEHVPHPKKNPWDRPEYRTLQGEMPWTIYCHIHIETERRYIGLTKKTMLQRWNQHVYMSNRFKRGYGHFPNAIRKYGKDAFSHEVLEVCNSLEEANVAEERWIELYNTRNPDKGFNLAKGGEHIPHPIRKNPWDRPEFREKQLKLLKKRWEDPAFRNKMVNISKDPSWQAKIRDPKNRVCHSVISKTLWEDPEFRNKCIKNRNKCIKNNHNSIKIKFTKKEEPIVPGKLCCRCHQPGSFGKDRHAKDGLKRACKKCEKIARQARKEDIQARGKRRRESNREKIRIYQAKYYDKNRLRITNRDRLRRKEINDRIARHKEELRGIIDEIKKSPCQVCGKSKKPDEMDFYRPGFKHHSVYWLINYNTSVERVIEEINKCKLLCINCYRKRVSLDLAI